MGQSRVGKQQMGALNRMIQDDNEPPIQSLTSIKDFSIICDQRKAPRKENQYFKLIKALNSLYAQIRELTAIEAAILGNKAWKSKEYKNKTWDSNE